MTETTANFREICHVNTVIERESTLHSFPPKPETNFCDKVERATGRTVACHFGPDFESNGPSFALNCVPNKQFTWPNSASSELGYITAPTDFERLFVRGLFYLITKRRFVCQRTLDSFLRLDSVVCRFHSWEMVTPNQTKNWSGGGALIEKSKWFRAREAPSSFLLCSVSTLC